jgi:hypothetical protein
MNEHDVHVVSNSVLFSAALLVMTLSDHCCATFRPLLTAAFTSQIFFISRLGVYAVVAIRTFAMAE